MNDDCATLARFDDGRQVQPVQGARRARLATRSSATYAGVRGPFENVVYNNKAEYLAGGGKPAPTATSTTWASGAAAARAPMARSTTWATATAAVARVRRRRGGPGVKAPGKWSNRSVTCSPCPPSRTWRRRPRPPPPRSAELVKGKQAPLGDDGQLGRARVHEGLGPAHRQGAPRTKTPSTSPSRAPTTRARASSPSPRATCAAGPSSPSAAPRCARRRSAGQGPSEAGGGSPRAPSTGRRRRGRRGHGGDGGRALTVTAIVEEGSAAAVNVLFTGAEKGSAPLPAPASPTAAPPAAPSAAASSSAATGHDQSKAPSRRTPGRSPAAGARTSTPRARAPRGAVRARRRASPRSTRRGQQRLLERDARRAERGQLTITSRLAAGPGW